MRQYLGGQIVRNNGVPVCEDAQTLHEIFKLAHVAWPGIRHKDPPHFLREPQHRTAPFLAETLEKGLSEKEYITPALTQRGELNRNDIEAVEKVLAEAALCNFRFEVAVGGRHHAHVHLARPGSAYGLDLVLLQHAQEFDLQKRIHFAHFVQENSTATGHLKASPAGMHRAGKRSLLVTKKLGFQEFVGDGAAVDDHERPGCPPALLMQIAHGQFLASA